MTDQASLTGAATANGQIDVGITFGPTGSWADVVEGTLLAERPGLDTVGFWAGP